MNRLKRIGVISILIIMLFAIVVQPAYATEIESPLSVDQCSTGTISTPSASAKSSVSLSVENLITLIEDMKTEVPLYDQTDYDDVYWGGSHGRNTIAASGCGPTALAMVLSYLFDEEITPVDVASEYGEYYYQGQGSAWALFTDSAKDYDINVVKTSEWDAVVEALENGCVVIALQSSGSVFTRGGHFIVFTGITEDGKVLVNDPNGWNYEKKALQEGFENGFEQVRCYEDGGPYWIYESKYEDVDTILAELLNTPSVNPAN